MGSFAATTTELCRYFTAALLPRPGRRTRPPYGAARCRYVQHQALYLPHRGRAGTHCEVAPTRLPNGSVCLLLLLLLLPPPPVSFLLVVSGRTKEVLPATESRHRCCCCCCCCCGSPHRAVLAAGAKTWCSVASTPARVLHALSHRLSTLPRAHPLARSHRSTPITASRLTPLSLAGHARAASQRHGHLRRRDAAPQSIKSSLWTDTDTPPPSLNLSLLAALRFSPHTRRSLARSLVRSIVASSSPP